MQFSPCVCVISEDEAVHLSEDCFVRLTKQFFDECAANMKCRAFLTDSMSVSFVSSACFVDSGVSSLSCGLGSSSSTGSTGVGGIDNSFASSVPASRTRVRCLLLKKNGLHVAPNCDDSFTKFQESERCFWQVYEHDGCSSRTMLVVPNKDQISKFLLNSLGVNIKFT